MSPGIAGALRPGRGATGVLRRAEEFVVQQCWSYRRCGWSWAAGRERLWFALGSARGTGASGEGCRSRAREERKAVRVEGGKQHSGSKYGTRRHGVLKMCENLDKESSSVTQSPQDLEGGP